MRKVLHDLSDNFLSIYLDVSEFPGKGKTKLTEEKFLKVLLNKINDAVQENDTTFKGLKDKFFQVLNKLKLKNYSFNGVAEIFDIPIPIIRDNYDELAKFVIELPQKVVDSSENINGFVIVIDEFQLLKNLEDPESFFCLIRSSTQRQFNVSYIFTGSVSRTANIIEMINGQDGAFGGRLININLDPFSKEETRRYIDERSNNITFTDDGFEQFYKCTRGIPLYINSFASVLPNNIVCDNEILKNILTYNIDQVASPWVSIWSRLKPGEKDFIIFLLENGSAFREDFEKNHDYVKSSVFRFIDSLLNNGIIEYTPSGYIICDNMLQYWLKIKHKQNGYYPL